METTKENYTLLYTNRLRLKWQSIYAFLNLKRKRCFISSYRKAYEAERQLTKQISRPLEGKNKALLKAYPRINSVYFRSQYHEYCLCVASTALSLNQEYFVLSCTGPWQFCAYGLARVLSILLQARGRFLSAWPHRYRWEPRSLMRKSSATQPLHNLEASLKA